MNTLFIILLVISSIVIIGTTLVMEPKTGAGSMYGQDANAFGTSAYHNRDHMLNKFTVISAVVFVVSLIGLVLVSGK